MGAKGSMYRTDFGSFRSVAIGILFFAVVFCLAPLQHGMSVLAQDFPSEQILPSSGPITAKLPEVTRVVITTSGPVMYEHYQKADPPRIVIQFSSRNLISQMEEKVEVNRGVVREIQCRYYTRVTRWEVGEEGRPLKSLVIVLTQVTTYQIVEEGKAIIIAIKNPPEILIQEFGLGEIEIAQVPPEEEREVIEEELVADDDRDEALIMALSQAQAKLTGEEVPPEELKGVRAPIRVEEEITHPALAAEVAPRVIKEGPVGRVKEIARPSAWYETRAFYIGDLSLVFVLGGLLLWLKARRASIRGKKAELEEERVGDLAEVEKLSKVSPAIFERLIVKVFERRGYKVLSAREVAGKGLVSIIAKEGERALLQYKGEEDFLNHFFVQDFYQSMVKEKADRGYLVTTGSFSYPARKEASTKPIDLIDRGQLLELVNSYLKEAEEGKRLDRGVSPLRVEEETQKGVAVEKEAVEKEAVEKEAVEKEARVGEDEGEIKIKEAFIDPGESVKLQHNFDRIGKIEESDSSIEGSIESLRSLKETEPEKEEPEKEEKEEERGQNQGR